MKIIEKRPYQERVINKALEAVQHAHKSLIIVAPTGSGKTYMGLRIAERLHQEYGWTTGWTAMRKHLITQAYEENLNTIGFPHIQFFSTFCKPEQIPKDIDVLIEDEAVHSATITSTENFKLINPKVHIGLSAYPIRVDRLSLLFSKSIKDAGTRQLIDAGYLSPFHQYIFHDNWEPEVISQIYLQQRERWGKTVIFFLTEDECDRCADLIRVDGVNCEVVTGSSNQEKQIKAFHDGDVDVLLNMVVLTEGFDCDLLKTVFIRPGSKGPTLQMGGRALRRHPSKQYAQIVQNGLTHWPFSKLASPEKKFISQNGLNWESREDNDRVSQAQQASIMAISKINTFLPDYVKKFGKKHYMAINTSND